MFEGRDMIMNRGKENWKRKGEEWKLDKDFIFLFAKGLIILLFWLTVPLPLVYCICYVLGGIDTREVFFSLLPSSSILRVYKQHVIDGRDKECLPVLNVTLLYNDSPMSSFHFCHSHSDQV